VFLKAGLITPAWAALVGGISIGIGVLTFSKRVMYTVGRGITQMSEFAALIAVLGQDVTVHIFSWVGVPVSTSQAIVGAVMGVGLVKSSSAVNFRVIGKIMLGWLSTPISAYIIAFALLKLYDLLF
jgi:PiT family inorganic phosphate transporter